MKSARNFRKIPQQDFNKLKAFAKEMTSERYRQGHKFKILIL